MGESVSGIFLPETREELLQIVARLKAAKDIQGLILDGTELPFILRDVDECETPFSDATKIHAEHAAAWMLS